MGLATTLIFAGATLLYLAAPTQKLAPRRLGRRYILAGWLVLVLAFSPLLAATGPATAVFTWITGAMLAWSLVPLAVAWWRGPPRDKQ